MKTFFHTAHLDKDKVVFLFFIFKLLQLQQTWRKNNDGCAEQTSRLFPTTSTTTANLSVSLKRDANYESNIKRQHMSKCFRSAGLTLFLQSRKRVSPAVYLIPCVVWKLFFFFFPEIHFPVFLLQSHATSAHTSAWSRYWTHLSGQNCSCPRPVCVAFDYIDWLDEGS